MELSLELSASTSESDDFELRVKIQNDTCRFETSMYCTHRTLQEFLTALQRFRLSMRSGIIDFQFGAFGPEYASGACHLRFYIAAPGEIYIRIRGESEFRKFGSNLEANKVTLLLRTEPVLLDNFVQELEGFSTRPILHATLRCIALARL